MMVHMTRLPYPLELFHRPHTRTLTQNDMVKWNGTSHENTMKRESCAHNLGCTVLVVKFDLRRCVDILLYFLAA